MTMKPVQHRGCLIHQIEIDAGRGKTFKRYLIEGLGRQDVDYPSIKVAKAAIDTYLEQE